MEAVLGTQHQRITIGMQPHVSPRSRRARRHRSEVYFAHRDLRPGNVLIPEQTSLLAGAQQPNQALFIFGRPLNKLDELKTRRFTSIGRQARIAQSLAALREPNAIHMTQGDWQWLDAHSDIEDEFE
jgi:hypothetical protein